MIAFESQGVVPVKSRFLLQTLGIGGTLIRPFLVV